MRPFLTLSAGAILTLGLVACGNGPDGAGTTPSPTTPRAGTPPPATPTPAAEPTPTPTVAPSPTPERFDEGAYLDEVIDVLEDRHEASTEFHRLLEHPVIESAAWQREMQGAIDQLVVAAERHLEMDPPVGAHEESHALSVEASEKLIAAAEMMEKALETGNPYAFILVGDRIDEATELIEQSLDAMP